MILMIPTTSTMADSSCRGASALRVLALRLPDVIGPHENTGRLRSLLLRLLRGKRIGTSINGHAGLGERLPLSMVAAGDVAAAVCAALDNARPTLSTSSTVDMAKAVVLDNAPATRRAPDGEEGGAPPPSDAPPPPPSNHLRGNGSFTALHICADERLTWVTFVHQAAAALEAEGLEVPTPRFDAERDTGFVSVDFGALDNAAAKEALSSSTTAGLAAAAAAAAGPGGSSSRRSDGGDAGVVAWSPAPLPDRVKEAVAWWVQSQRDTWERERVAEEEEQHQRTDFVESQLREALKKRRLRRDEVPGRAGASGEVEQEDEAFRFGDM